MKRRIGLILLAPLILAGCSNKIGETYSSTAIVFNSFFTCKYFSNAGSLNDEINATVNKINQLADPYTDYNGLNNLYKINETNEAITVDPILFDLVKTAMDLYQKTEHNFNPFIGKITSVWKTVLFGESGDSSFSGPTVSSIEETKALIPSLLNEANSTSVLLNEDNCTITRVGQGHIDLGGLTKGYAVEQVKKMLKAKDIGVYLVNGGQSSLGLGKTQDGGEFKVDLKYSKEQYENRYSLGEIDTSTSAIYEQSIIVDGTTYSHIINPTTGMPLTAYSMAFLVGEDSTLLDAFSTSCIIAGPEKAEEWGNKYGFSYSLFKDDGGYTKLVKESDSLSKARI